MLRDVHATKKLGQFVNFSTFHRIRRECSWKKNNPYLHNAKFATWAELTSTHSKVQKAKENL